MNQDKYVTIIVPVYNVEKYLPECIESLINQTYKNIQIILVDDASTDKCSEICDWYAEKDDRITVIHKEINSGAASARNKGIDNAEGEYICFVDSDDYILPDFVEKLLANLYEYDADIAVCSFTSVFCNRQERYSFSDRIKVFTNKEYLEQLLVDWTCALACNKIFKAKLLENVRYEEGHKIDDEFFTYRLIMRANRIVQIDDSLYMYRMRASSVMKSAKNEKQRFCDQIDFMEKRYINIKNEYPELKKSYIENLADNFIRFFRCNTLYEECAKALKNCIKRNWKDFLFIDYSWILKILIIFYFLTPMCRLIKNSKMLLENGNESQEDLFS